SQRSLSYFSMSNLRRAWFKRIFDNGHRCIERNRQVCKAIWNEQVYHSTGKLISLGHVYTFDRLLKLFLFSMRILVLGELGNNIQQKAIGETFIESLFKYVATIRRN